MQPHTRPHDSSLHLQEAVLSVPASLRVVDRSINILSTSDSDGFALTINRDQCSPDEDLERYVRRQSQELQAKLPLFELDNLRSHAVGSHRALVLQYTWSDSAERFAQLQAFVELHQRILIFTATAKEPLTEQRRSQFFALLDSAEFRGP